MRGELTKRAKTGTEHVSQTTIFILRIFDTYADSLDMEYCPNFDSFTLAPMHSHKMPQNAC